MLCREEHLKNADTQTGIKSLLLYNNVNIDVLSKQMHVLF